MGYRDPANYSYTTGDNADSIASLTKRVEELEAGGGSGGTTDYNKLKNKPWINGTELIGNVTVEGTKNYNDLENKPKLNNQTLQGNITIDATKNYEELENKPQINSVELEGDKTSSDLHISGGGSAPSVIGENLIFE